MQTTRLLASALCVMLCSSPAPGEFPDGVAAGDLTATSVVLWTRLDSSAEARVEVAADPFFATLVAVQVVPATPERDLTIKVVIDDLTPGTPYHYRFVSLHDGAISPAGRFRTAPPDDVAGPFRCVFSGDTNYAFAPFGVAARIAYENADAFIWFGDTIYADVPAGGLGVATTLDEYRAKYRQIRSDAGIRAALESTPIWVGGDDHEVTNDYAGLDPALSPEQRDAGYRAFFEYMPIRESGDPADPYRTYRSIRFGSGVVLMFLDARQYRVESAREACGSNPDPDGFVLGPLVASGDCRSQLRAPRDFLGRAQLEWLMHELIDAGDAVKLVINNVPISYIGVWPYDRWDGYDAERRELLEFIHANRIRDVTFLTTDIHASAYNPDVSAYFRRARPDYRLAADVVVPEIIVGPLGTATLHQSLRGIGGAVLGDGRGASGVFGLLESVLTARLRCANGLRHIETNRVSYVVLDVDEGKVRVAYRGAPPREASDPDAPLETFFETTVADRPSAAGGAPCFLPWAVVVAGAALTRVASRASTPRRRRGTARRSPSRRGAQST